MSLAAVGMGEKEHVLRKKFSERKGREKDRHFRSVYRKETFKARKKKRGGALHSSLGRKRRKRSFTTHRKENA